MRALTEISTRKHFSKYAYLLKQVRRTYIDWGIVAKSPLGRYSCIAQGASPGLIIETYLLSPVGAALPRRKANARVVVPLLWSSYFVSMFTQGFISGFALIPPWAMQEYRAYGTRISLNCKCAYLLK